MFASTVFSLNALTSAPAEKNLSDALRTTTTFTASSLAAASTEASASSSMNARSYEFAGGLSSVTTPMPVVG